GARAPLPARVEPAYPFLGVQHEAHAAVELGLGVPVLGFLHAWLERNTQRAEELDAAPKVADHDADRVQLAFRHLSQDRLRQAEGVPQAAVDGLDVSIHVAERLPGLRRPG